ncbi:hypothetical protein ABPG77_001862 [Micractinium sp. CCAP 211/92]
MTADASSGAVAAARLALAAEQAASGGTYKVVKLRCRLGRKFFCASHRHCESPASLGRLTLGFSKDLQSYFSNAVPLAGVSRLVDRLQEVGHRAPGRAGCSRGWLAGRGTLRYPAARPLDGSLGAHRGAPDLLVSANRCLPNMQMGFVPAGTERTLSAHLYRADNLSPQALSFWRTE